MAVAAPTLEPQTEESRWGLDSSAVRKALTYIKKQGSVTSDELVEWDRTHGRRLFKWDDAEAGPLWRLHEARVFLNSFRGYFEKKRIRAFIHIDEDPEQGIDRGAYFTPEDISNHPGMRAQVIRDISKRISRLASELKLWKLSDGERDALLARWREQMTP